MAHGIQKSYGEERGYLGELVDMVIANPSQSIEQLDMEAKLPVPPGADKQLFGALLKALPPNLMQSLPVEVRERRSGLRAFQCIMLGLVVLDSYTGAVT